jgi:hypothetical protein
VRDKISPEEMEKLGDVKALVAQVNICTIFNLFYNLQED